MTKSDGGLRALFQKKLPGIHWQSVETWSTGRGVPDVNYCHRGTEGWIEFKSADAWRVKIRPEQVAWIERRARAGGLVRIIVRRKRDELWIFPSRSVRDLATKRLDECVPVSKFYGGPAKWNWEQIMLDLHPTRR